jgi:hypothetical protein
MIEELSRYELNRLVAEKVFGMVKCTNIIHDPTQKHYYPNTDCYADPDSPSSGGETRDYAGDIREAWRVVEHMTTLSIPEFHEWFELAGWSLSFLKAERAAREICIAALRCMEEGNANGRKD